MKRRIPAIKILSVAVAVVLIALTLALPPSGGTSSADGEFSDLSGMQLPPKGHDKLESRLDQLARAEEQGKARPFIQQHAVGSRDGRVRVIIEVEPGNKGAVVNKVKALGGAHETDYQNLLQVLMPVPQLKNLADDGNVKLVRLPFKPVPFAIGEGVGVINADSWKNAGFNGAGTRVGIIDVGFSGYSSLLGSELPGTVTTWWAPSIGGPGTEVHGTACAEIIYDIAPNAQFFLANFATEVEFGNAASWLIAQGVNVISNSTGWFGTGPGDGSGPIGNAVTTARNAGILWCNAAGNHSQRHWSGSWQDADADNLHDFNLNPRDETQTISVQANQTIEVYLTWNDPWGASANDYDLYLLNSSLQIVDQSENEQDGNDYPREKISGTSNVSATYHIVIARYSATGAAFFHLTSWNHNLQYQVASGSIAQPADSANALTVGAVPWNAPNTLETFSSQGPTTDGRIKPDLVAPDGISSVAYGGSFFGTSASAPHAAGAALLVKQRYPSYTPAQLQSYLETNAIDLGAPGEDNLYGNGLLNLPVAPQISFTPATDTTIAAGQTVTFVAHLDSGSPVADADWKWDFDYHTGDTDVDATGITPPPQNWNNVAGTYVVKLTATNAAGSDTETRTITVLGPVDRVVVSPNPAFLQATATQQFTPSAYDQYGNPIPGLSYTWSVVNGGGAIGQNGLFTAGATVGTFPNTIKAEASYGGATRHGTATVAIGATMTVTATLQGDRTEAGMNVPLTLKLYDQPVTPLNIRTLPPVGVFSTAEGNIALTNRNTTTKVITFTVGGLSTGTFNITLFQVAFKLTLL